jgi:hypothetical protein
MPRESRRGERYYRFITSCVMQRYYELEDGILGPERGLGHSGGPTFDPRVLNYRIDVERILDKLPPADRTMLDAVYRDGLSDADALRTAGLNAVRPDDVILRLELRLGALFERAKLMDLEGYIA